MFKRENKEITQAMKVRFGENFVESHIKDECRLSYLIGKILGTIFMQLFITISIVGIFYVFIIFSQSL